MNKTAARSVDDKVAVDMTPMIDVVFQLLVFFALTLNVVEAEGDFRIRMPTFSQGTISDRAPPPLHVELRSNGAGELQSLLLNQRVLANFADLRREIAFCVHADDAHAGELEVEIASDPDLRYEFMIAAITAVSGERTREGKLVQLIERIKFAPPRP